jgi:uncharacterized protein YggT (Ycf19 family)
MTQPESGANLPPKQGDGPAGHDVSSQATQPLVTERSGLAGDLYPIQTFVEVPAETKPASPSQQQALDTYLAQEISDYRLERASQRRRQIDRFVRYMVTVGGVFLALRLVLKLTGANPSSPFAAFVYTITAPLLLPFQSLFPNPSAGRFVFEATTLVAMIVYPIFTWLLLKGVYLYYLHGRRRRQTISYHTTVEASDE